MHDISRIGFLETYSFGERAKRFVLRFNYISNKGKKKSDTGIIMNSLLLY